MQAAAIAIDGQDVRLHRILSAMQALWYKETIMQASPTAISYEKGRYKETCGPCGAVFEVIVIGGPMAKSSQEQVEEYGCPECGQVYRCRGSEPPRVSLISKRTDGS